MPSALPPTITCERVVSITDADTIRARCGGRIVKVRLAGISALERDGSCNSRPNCATMPYAPARRIATRLMLGKQVVFRIRGRSGDRLVGDHRPWRCALIASGAVVTWRRYAQAYRLKPCGRGR